MSHTSSQLAPDGWSCKLQGLNLTQLPKDVLTALLRQLSRKQQATLRLVCKQLADIIRLHTTQASTTQRMTRQAAQALDSRFPQLASLTCTRPVSMHYICQLTRLTSIRLGDKEADNMYQLDLAPLEELPELHSLHLESVELHTLKPTSFCGLAALTQLKHLCLDQCEAAEESDRPSGFHNFSALPQTTYLQVLDSIDGDVRGVANLHKVKLSFRPALAHIQACTSSVRDSRIRDGSMFAQCMTCKSCFWAHHSVAREIAWPACPVWCIKDAVRSGFTSQS